MKTWSIKLLLCFLLLGTCLLRAQETVPDAGFGIGETAAEPKTTAAFVNGQLQITYDIPTGHHMVKQEEFVTFSIHDPGYRLGKIIYPAGHKNATNDEEYLGTVVLSAPLER